MIMKSIHFPPSIADDMVRAILKGRKTVTRRVVKPQPTFFYTYGGRISDPNNPDNIVFLAMSEKNGEDTEEIFVPPYQPDDILYVRETFCRQPSEEYPFVYKASVETPAAWRWCPSIHMPREAARIFLRVTDVRVERLQEITNEQAQAEGAKGWMVATDRDWDKNPNYILAFRYAWDSTIKKADRALYGWEADPWVWVIEFERVSREEAAVGTCQ